MMTVANEKQSRGRRVQAQRDYRISYQMTDQDEGECTTSQSKESLGDQALQTRYAVQGGCRVGRLARKRLGVRLGS